MGPSQVGKYGVLLCGALCAALAAACEDDTHTTTTVGGADDGAAGSENATAGMPAAGGSSASQAGSGQGQAGTAPLPDAPTDLEAFLEAEGKGYCERVYRCYEPNDDFLSSRWLLESVAGCEAQVALVNQHLPSIRDLRAEVEAGHLHYDPATAQKCLQELSTCSGANSFTDGSCREVFDGEAKSGEACFRDYDCAGDAFCLKGLTCAGQCQPRKAPGEPCDETSECAFVGAFVFCDQDLAVPVCGSLKPAPNAGENEPCTRRGQGNTELVRCDDSLWCAPDGPDLEAPLGTCKLPITPEESCSDGDDVCSEGLCDSDLGMCVPFTRVTKAGELCDKAQLVICDPRLGLRCSDAGMCEGSGDGSEGAACFSGDFQKYCDVGLYCQLVLDGPNGTCQPQLESGSPCEQGNQCQSGSCETTCVERYCSN